MQAHPLLEVFICTAPIVRSRYCHQEKVEWVRFHFGAEGDQWVQRIIITSDKSMVNGDILIDDAPKAKASVLRPSWEHVWFEQAYNKDLHGQRRLSSWRSWRSIVFPEGDPVQP
eukprot:TRINITY_DN31330_c0_g1_i1.p2 TRINITY_DN31330_c0_g1~~TRINITY_DN31330_c0_g1_i1.p2  ORF type:complete len:114 (-),score=22.53 TRINITY_DN31330_c0_g1_i1:49-390(-)